MKTTIVLNISGGVLCAAISNDPNIKIILFDRDNLKEEMSSDKIDKKWEKLSEKYPYELAIQG